MVVDVCIEKMKIFAFILFCVCLFSNVLCEDRELNEDNWREILDGEWMVEFFAPWCPACNALQPAWKQLSSKLPKGTRTGGVDVTKSPGLSGRFVVTALPTIFHVKNAEFRQYKGPRDAESMLNFIMEQKWQQVDPIPSWKSPNSLQMTLLAEFFKLSQVLRSVHTMLMETYGLPTWGSYLIFAIATIFIGAILGLVLVCIIDLLYPPKRSSEKVVISKEEMKKFGKEDVDLKEKSDEDGELINEDIVDEEMNDSDAEKNSGSDSSSSSESEDLKTKEAGGDAVDNKTSEVRKRRPRKAD